MLLCLLVSRQQANGIGVVRSFLAQYVTVFVFLPLTEALLPVVVWLSTRYMPLPLVVSFKLLELVAAVANIFLCNDTAV